MFRIGLITLAFTLIQGLAASERVWASTPAAGATSSSVSAPDRGFSGSGQVTFDGQDYLYSPSSSSALLPTLNVSGSADYQKGFFEAKGQGELMLLMSSTTNVYFEAPELYFGTSDKTGPVGIEFGRKLEHWSMLDETWQLGIFQPRFRWDYVRPEQVGLIGAFPEIRSEHARIVGLLSPGFIPERGVNVNVQDGHFTSDSPWVIPPSNTVSLFGQNTSTYYSIDVPSIAEIVYHPGASIMAELRENDARGERGFWGSYSYAYLPVNQLPLGFEAYLALSPIEVPVIFHPRVLYHHLNSVQGGYETAQWTAWASALVENPVRDETPETWTTQELTDSTAVAVGGQLRLGDLLDNPTQINFSLLRQRGGNGDDQGQYATPGASVFEQRYPFQDAALLGWRSPWIWSKLAFGTGLIYDFDHAGQIISTELTYKLRRAWTLAFGGDFFRSNEPGDGTEPGADFINRYQSYDRIHAGVTYAF